MSEEEIEEIEERYWRSATIDADDGSRDRVASARKRFGQHFLEPAWVDKVIRAIAPATDETCSSRSAGPRRADAAAGRARPAASSAFEIDRDLAADARATRPPPNLTIVEGDFLDVTAPTLCDGARAGARAGPVRVAGNLPYNVASPILFKLLELYAAGRAARATRR